MELVLLVLIGINVFATVMAIRSTRKLGSGMSLTLLGIVIGWSAFLVPWYFFGEVGAVFGAMINLVIGSLFGRAPRDSRPPAMPASSNAREFAQRVGLPGAAAAMGRPADFFAHDWATFRPANPTVVSIEAYGPILDQALSTGDAVNDLGPDELDTLQAATQALASVRPAEAHFLPVHYAAVDYLESRIAEAVASGRYSAALFNSNDRKLVNRLSQEKDRLEIAMNRKLSALQSALRRLFQNSVNWFENLGLENSTLTWLYLDDIVDSR